MSFTKIWKGKKSIISTWLVTGIFLILLSACGPNPTVTTPTLYPTVTTEPTIPASPTVSVPSTTPSPTPTPAPTPFSGISFSGPSILVEFDKDRKSSKDNFFLAYSPAGDQITFQLPGDGSVLKLSKAVSPDGKWLAYSTGTVNSPSPDRTLKIISLKTGRVERVSSLAQAGFPESLRPLAENLEKLHTQDLENKLSADSWLELIQPDFKRSLGIVAWSPDSRSLAFSAQLDGPSTDVYAYDLKSKQIRRLVDDPDNIFDLEWSPDGNWVLYQNTIPGPVYSQQTLSFVPSAGGPFLNPKDFSGSFWWKGEGWLSNNQYVITSLGDGGSPSNIRIINIETGQVKQIWPESYLSFAFSSDYSVFLICGPDNNNQLQIDDPSTPSNSYLVQLNGSRKLLSGQCFRSMISTGWNGAEFIGSFQGEYAVTGTNGNIKNFVGQDTISASISPDKKWVVFYGNQGIDIFAKPGQLVRSIPMDPVYSVRWNSDSKGLWLLGNNLLFINIPDGNPETIQLKIEDHEYHIYDSALLP